MTETLEAPRAAPATPLLSVEDVSVEFRGDDGWLRVVDGAHLDVAAGETLGLVGESGSGKTVLALATMGLLPRRVARVASGAIRFRGEVLPTGDREAMRRLRGDQLSMVFQEPMTSLNPAYTVGSQIAEVLRVHRGASRGDARARVVELLDLVGIPDAARRARDYPHAFSGGMRQRAMLAMAIACEPRLLIADEPTTALDVTVQAQILDLLRRLQAELGMAVLFITHDLGVVAELCDRVTVLYAGQVVEQAGRDRLFARPRHPYTEALLGSLPQTVDTGGDLRTIPGRVPRPSAFPAGCRFHPRCAYAQDQCRREPIVLHVAGAGTAWRCVRADELRLAGAATLMAETGPDAPARRSHGDRAPVEPAPLLQVAGLTKRFPVHSAVLRRTIGEIVAVDDVAFTVAAGETLGLVGESGSGKSTVVRLVAGLLEPSAGTVTLDGTDLATLSAQDLRRRRRALQIVFQDPFSSLDPRATIAETVGEPLVVHEGLRRRARDERVAALLDEVGMGAEALRRYPHEFSGGQRQRIAIARALALQPDLLLCDEPVSSLDASTRSQVINLLMSLQARHDMAYLFISHDLSVVRHMSDRIAVMYLGRIVESGPAGEVSSAPTHPYTAALVSAIPIPDPVQQRRTPRLVLRGEVPSPLNPPPGCHFQGRCPHVMDICRTEEPPPFTTPSGTVVRCHLHEHGPRLAGAPVPVLVAGETPRA